jgi:hypothetical protein
VIATAMTYRGIPRLHYRHFHKCAQSLIGGLIL